MTDEILRSALYGAHVAGGATMGRECGWEVPMSYRDAQTEAAEVRKGGGLRDWLEFRDGPFNEQAKQEYS